jgi:hypothetical protein
MRKQRDIVTFESGAVVFSLANYSTSWHDDGLAAVFIAPPIDSLLTTYG